MSDQKNWDAALINTWRRAGSVQDAIVLFKAIGGKRTDECDQPLKRFPLHGFPWSTGIRVFVASYLPKISDRLWNQTPDKDILLLRKLETSSYDTAEIALRDNSLDRERSQYIRNRKKVGMSSLNVSNQNHDTDWNVTKGSVRIGRRK